MDRAISGQHRCPSGTNLREDTVGLIDRGLDFSMLPPDGGGTGLSGADIGLLDCGGSHPARIHVQRRKWKGAMPVQPSRLKMPS